MDGAQIETNPGQGFQVDLERGTRAHATHTRHLTGAGTSVTDRADPTEAFELFPGFFPDGFHVHCVSSCHSATG